MPDIATGLRSTSDGWRAIIAEDFTFDNVYRISWAIGKYISLNVEKADDRKVLIAHDTRFMGDIFAQLIINTLHVFNIQCHYIPYPIPTPILSWYTFHQGYSIGIMVTASHNPPYYNGIKIRMPYGGPPEKEVLHAIEGNIPHGLVNFQADEKPDYFINPIPAYIEMARSLIDLHVIDRAAPIIAVDPMHGTTAGLLSDLLKDTRAKVIQIRANHDPLFGGISPEPKSTTIDPLMQCVHENGCILGVSHDGDGDRIVAVDPFRGFLSPHDIFTFLSYDLAKRRKLPGGIIGSVSVTRRVQRVANLLGRIYYEVPIGFRNAAQIMRTKNILIAGEENGGIGVGMHMPERDGTLIAALLVDAISYYGIGVGQLLDNIEKQVGKSSFLRKDINIATDSGNIIQSFVNNPPESIANLLVKNISREDGVKFYLQDGSWVLLRAAGTEPLLRIYCESDNDSTCSMIIDNLSRILEGRR